MKKLLFLGACLVALASQPVMAQTGGADVVVVRVVVYGSRMSIAIKRGQAKAEVREVDIPISSFKQQAEVTEGYQSTVTQLLQEGYLLKGMSGGDSYTTFIFTKGQ